MASRGINKVILIGHVGQNPEIRYMPNGIAVSNFTMATSETWKDKKTGDNKEKTEWHRIVLFGKLAEIANEYVRKGSQLYIEGTLKTRKWQDNSGQDRYTTEIIVNIGGTMQMLGNKNITDNANISEKLHQSNQLSKFHSNQNINNERLDQEDFIDKIDSEIMNFEDEELPF